VEQSEGGGSRYILVLIHVYEMYEMNTQGTLDDWVYYQWQEGLAWLVDVRRLFPFRHSNNTDTFRPRGARRGREAERARSTESGRLCARLIRLLGLTKFTTSHARKGSS
jgi:hypothetical protein